MAAFAGRCFSRRWSRPRQARWFSMLTAWEKKAQVDGFLPDACQKRALAQLEALRSALCEKKQAAPLRGMYIYGGVGTGKTMMLDLFHQELTAAGINCQRQHFHEFLQAVHMRLHKLRQRIGSQPSLLALSAREYKEEFPVLAFDEAHVLNVGDALMLRTFFEAYFQAGGVMVATSNVAPDDLYASGINREVFLPFLDALRERCDFFEMRGRHDYRERAVEAGRLRGAYFWRKEELPSMQPTPDQLPVLTQALGVSTDEMPRTASSAKIDVGFGRTLVCDSSWKIRTSRSEESGEKQVVHFGFNDLCRTATGPSEWVGLADYADAIIVSEVPHFQVHDEDAARRFITFVDIVYDRQRFLVVTAETSPDKIFSELVEKYGGDPETMLPAREEATSSAPSQMKMPAHGLGSGRHGVVFQKPKQLQYSQSGGYVTTSQEAEEQAPVEKAVSVTRTGGRAEHGLGSADRVMQGVVQEDTDWVEWSATGLKDASLFDLSPTGSNTEINDKLLPFRRCASRLNQMQVQVH
eukprot:TRINITY_DN76228_c0_g1_i1.p1 TRINITY_DN76228_c0_g1~~TRINITY_DN76228_c0_g1_i1.p1  ORF type:complete len:536 (-),score=114.47 TRINITY_DN76228_c0_g1_i1:40-1611(-)